MENFEKLSEQEFQKHAEKIVTLYPSFILVATESEQDALCSTMIRLLETNTLVPAKTLILFYIHFFANSVNDQVIDLIRNQSIDAIDLKSEINVAVGNLKKWEKGWGKKKIKISFDVIMGTVTILAFITMIWPKQCENLLQDYTKTIIFIYQSILADEKDSKETKLSILSLLQVLLKNKWWDVIPTATREEADRCLSDFCDWGLVIMEDTVVEGKVNTLGNAPLLVDFEIRYHLVSDLQQICINLKTMFDLDFTRLESFMNSLKNLVIYSGNVTISTSKRTIEMVPKYEELDTDLLLNVSAVHDLFPELGMGFIELCLKEYSNDSETVIMKILEDSLPSHIANLDRKMESLRLSDTTNVPLKDSHGGSTDTLASFHSFENEQVMTTANSSKPENANATRSLNTEELERAEFIRLHKNLILASAAGFEEEDEYDDTYDGVQTLGLEPDQEDAPKTNNSKESYLINFYLSDPSAFHPSNRKSKIREEMKSHLGQSDEQLEGWYLMLNRNVTVFLI